MSTETNGLSEKCSICGAPATIVYPLMTPVVAFCREHHNLTSCRRYGVQFGDDGEHAQAPWEQGW